MDNGSIWKNCNGPSSTESSAIENYLKVKRTQEEKIGPWWKSKIVKMKAFESAIGDTGYIAPEHEEPVTDNTKGDIYAFGVLLLELLTGRRGPFDRSTLSPLPQPNCRIIF